MALDSFVLRVVVDAVATGGAVGEVQHVASGRRAPFGTVDELLAFVRAHADDADRDVESLNPMT